MSVRRPAPCLPAAPLRCALAVLVVPYSLRCALAAFAVLATFPSAAPCQSAGGYGDYLAWENWARVAPGEHGGLASSWDRAGGHFDANQYESPPGLLQGNYDTVARTIAGPGILYRFWMSHFCSVKPFRVRMYFDGETTPRIDSDSRQILGGTYSYFRDPLVNTFAGGQVCYEPIPFRESLRIETENRAYMWHWYQYSFRTFPTGTDLSTYSGTLDAPTDAARQAVVAMFQNVGQHPAGESATAVRHVAGPQVVSPGGDLIAADLTGPGLIRRVNLRLTAPTDAAMDSLRLQVFYDNESTPAIDAPVSWFFGAGHGRALYKSLPLGTDSPAGFYCYWPMPFHVAARVGLKNVSASSVGVDSAVVEVEPKPVASNAGYLHVATKLYIRPWDSDWNVMVSVNGTGHYVGNLLYIQENFDDQTFLEGDDLVVVDGADSLHGTGTEDAYNGGSYYAWAPDTLSEPEGNFPPFAFRPLNGVLRVDKTTNPPFAVADQYRWRIGDRVPFSRSLEVSVETSYATWYSQWISVVFWYQLPEVVSGAPVGSGGASARGLGLELAQNAPNPVTGSTMVRFQLPAEGRATLDLLDVRGRRVETLLDGVTLAGAHEIHWSRGRHPNGVYFFRLRAGDLTASRKLVLTR